MPLPPSIKLDMRQITLNLFCGANIEPMDTNLFGKDTCDPYINVDLGGMTIKSKTIKNTQRPCWHQQLLLPTMFPCPYEYLTISLMDKDSVGKDEFIGSLLISIKDIFDEKTKPLFVPFWAEVYGGHETATNKEVKKKQNSYPQLGTCFKGQIFLSVTSKKMADPILDVIDMENGHGITKPPAEKELELRLDVQYVTGFGGKISEYLMGVDWGGYKEYTKTYDAIDLGVLDFFQRITINGKFSHKNDNDISDVIIFICDRAKKNFPVYYRFKATELLSLNSNFQYLKLKSDPAFGEVEHDQAGIACLRIGIATPADWSSKAKGWNLLPSKSDSKFEKIKIICNLFQAKELPSGDEDGSADPQVDFYHYGSKCQSQILNNTLNPVYNERLAMTSFAINGIVCPLQIDVYDLDGTDQSDREFLGQSLVFLNKTMFKNAQGLQMVPEPEWIQLYSPPNMKMGKILVSFQLLDGNVSIPFQLQPILVPREKYRIKIAILGLRNLQSTGILPVKVPTINMNFTSVLRGGGNRTTKQVFKDFQTQPLESGPNPNIREVLNKEIFLAKEDNMMPVLSCQVNDNVLSLFNMSSNLGNFEIDLGEYSTKTKVYLKKQLEDTLKDLKQKRERQDAYSQLQNMITKLGRQIEGNQNFVQIDQQNYTKFSEQSTAQAQQPNSLENNNWDQKSKGRNSKESTAVYGALMTLSESKKLQQEYLDAQNITHSKPQDLRPPQIQEIKNEEFVEKENIMFLDDGSVKAKNEIDLKTHLLRNRYEVLGYNVAKQFNKQMRFKLKGPLEQSPYLGKNNIQEIDITRGKRIKGDENKLINFFFGKEEEYKKVGTFKGVIQIFPDEIIQNLIQLKLTIPGIPSSIAEFENSQLDQDLRNIIEVQVVVYVLEGQINHSKDMFSESDPYLVVKIGDQTQKGVVQQNQDNPKFLETFEFSHKFPGASTLTIQLFDEDTIGSDESIGETSLDLEARFFDQKWRQLPYVPIETRNLYCKESSFTMGSLKLWVECIPKNQNILNPKRYNKIWDISPRPPTDLEVRVVIWEIENIPSVDTEGASDYYVTAGFSSLNDIEGRTDTHLRAQDNCGSFNWRLKFNVKVDKYTDLNKFQLECRVFDMDLLSFNDYICSGRINLSQIIQSSAEAQSKVSMKVENSNYQDIREKVWVDMQINPTLQDQVGMFNGTARVLVSIDSVPKSLAEMCPVGSGRAEPNQEPYLPPPTGRMNFSLNPFTMLNQLVGRRFRAKMYCYCFCCCFIVLFILMLPMILSNIASQAILAPFT